MIYGRDLAFVHHAGFADLSRAAGPAVLERLRESGIERGLIVDLACGSGILARELTNAGFDVLGIDASAYMIRLARQTAAAARFVLRSIHDARIPRCAAVTAVGEGLTYLAGDEELVLTPLFLRIHRALPPGGLLIFDAVEHVPGAPMSYTSARAGDDWHVEVRVSEDTDRRVVTRIITVERRSGKDVATTQEVHRVGTLVRTELVAELEAIGFGVEIAETYGTFPLPARRFACVATRVGV